MRGLVTAFRTLTILPAPGRDADRPASALPWFTAVGFVLGIMLYGLYVSFDALTMRQWPEGTAIALLIAGTVLTGGLHLDGLSDSVDGFFGGRTRDEILRIMKDSRAGVFGSAAIVMVLILKWTCLVELVENRLVEWLVAAYAVSRSAQALLAVAFPYARSEPGTATGFVTGASALSLVPTAATASLVALLPGDMGWRWLFVLGGGWTAAILCGAWCRIRVGGITGDMLGACSEVVESGILAAGATLSAMAGR